MPQLLQRVRRFLLFRPSRHARLLARMDEVLLLINQTAEATRQECDRFLADATAQGSE
ncbi:hypothetical protein Pla175_43430 [Pirellulimonas nuda]|uniref:Uncharacterized protein n=1 Tax=Pirellulimonas nuda TaxID=2528009 RepID=A0A518DHI0_9BACT|nr:hypothetical protein [Pirellulimonas nuda]QDU90929.1 hypothetical protein Pla175_43430 [Pirellulimonas nuda]